LPGFFIKNILVSDGNKVLSEKNILCLILSGKKLKVLNHSLLLHIRSIIGLDSKSKINGGSFLLEPNDNTG